MAESLFEYIPSVTVPPADVIANQLLTAIDREAQRRAGEHVDQWRAFWRSTEATPQEIADSMNGSAVLFFAIARANIEHVAAVAALIGKTPADFMPLECLSAPQQVTVNQDGSVTIGS